ncbi:hypothetical protein [Dapis sp. BLCC M229]|uniref:hypothetical protein n=1 Tax=Dapis sp. BLCC M229 TaxID=3400188 RepID=UPI003CFB30A0
MAQEVDKFSVGLRCRLTQPTIYYKMMQKILQSILLPIFAVFAALLTGSVGCVRRLPQTTVELSNITLRRNAPLRLK